MLAQLSDINVNMPELLTVCGPRSCSVYIPLDLIEGAVFDVDDLLIGSEKLSSGENFHAEAFIYALIGIGAPLTEDDCEEIRSIVGDVCARDLLGCLYSFVGGDLLNSMGIEDGEQLGAAIAPLRAEYLLLCAKKDLIPVLDGARELIDTLVRNNKKVTIYTSSRRQVMEPLLDYLLGEEADTLIPHSVRVYGDEVSGKRKPHPFGWEKAAALLGLDPSELIAVDNSPNGIRGALEAGYMFAIGVNWGSPCIFDEIREHPARDAFREAGSLRDIHIDE